jgi:hypothetical protein
MPSGKRNGNFIEHPWIWLLLPLMLFGCSRTATTATNVVPSNVAVVAAPKPITWGITIVETAESKEISAISKQANVLFQAKDYDGLEAYAKKLRDSREHYDGGGWKFYFVYAGIELPEEASDAELTNQLAALQDWINARPDSITARVALADELVTYAWKARGDDWAANVTDSGWKLFNLRLNEALKVLNEAKSLKTQCPYWWTVMLRIDLGLSPERSQYDETFKEATTAWPDYKPYYNHRAVYLLPRWNGTEGEWESDLGESANRTSGEEGDLLYARVVWCMHKSHYFTNIFSETKLSWPRVDKGFDVMEKQFPVSLGAKSEHAYLAVLARDKVVARKQFDKLEGNVDLSVWTSREQFITFLAYSIRNY